MQRKVKRSLAILFCLALIIGTFAPVSFADSNYNNPNTYSNNGNKAFAADTVYINGNIYTVDKDFSMAAAMAVKDGQFVYVGNNNSVKKYIGKDTKVINLEGSTVLPGLIDSHLHYSGVGRIQQQLNVFWLQKQEILDMVAAAAEKAQPGEWILGSGWNQAAWDPAVFPTRLELDAVAPENPVALTRVCGHMNWANTMAMELAGIDKDGVITPDPTGGLIIRKTAEDEANGIYEGIEVGGAIGVFTDKAMGLITKNVKDPGEAALIERLKLAQDHILSYGITSVRDAGSDMATFNRMKNLYNNDELKIRIYMMSSQGATAEQFYQMPENERTGLFNDRLNVRSVKLMADGSLGSRGAWMLEDYSDMATRGVPQYTDEQIYNLVKGAANAGFQVNTHAIGDAANRQVLDTYERVINENNLTDHRYCIEHSQVVSLTDIPRFAELGVIPSMQFVHATSDLNMAELRVGPERIKGAYAWRKMIESGSIIPNGTDAQVELVNPYHGLYAAVTRMTRDGYPEGGWYPEECLTREEALRAETIWGAYAQFEENDIGSIEAGKHADFAIIDRDYMSCPDTELKDINALATVIAGEVVYKAEDFTLLDD